MYIFLVRNVVDTRFKQCIVAGIACKEVLIPFDFYILIFYLKKLSLAFESILVRFVNDTQCRERVKVNRVKANKNRVKKDYIQYPTYKDSSFVKKKKMEFSSNFSS